MDVVYMSKMDPGSLGRILLNSKCLHRLKCAAWSVGGCGQDKTAQLIYKVTGMEQI